jgi:hypothetical protein
MRKIALGVAVALSLTLNINEASAAAPTSQCRYTSDTIVVSLI